MTDQLNQTRHHPGVRPGAFAIVALVLSAVLAALSAGVLAAPGDLYVTNLADNTIDVYSPGAVKSVFATGFISPQGLAFDRDNNLHGADSGDGNIYKFDPAGNRTTFFTGLSAPLGLAYDGKRLVVAENGRDRIITLPLDQSGAPSIFRKLDGIVDVAVGGDTRVMVGGAVTFTVNHDVSVSYGLNGNAQGVTTVYRRDLGEFTAMSPQTTARFASSNYLQSRTRLSFPI